MKILIFLGSARESQPPSPKRVGLRVALYLKSLIANTDHEVEIIDPLDTDFPNIFKPHFSFDNKSVPKDLDFLSQQIKNADAYVMLSPEYNHSMSPTLSHMLNHFGSSLFAFKPSLIATYSQGQWGGARAAMSMRNFVGEIGCIAVSAMIHVPRAHQVFNENGEVAEEHDPAHWESYFQRSLSQLFWWGEACSEKTKSKNPHDFIKSFKKSPDERNAPRRKE